MKFTNSILSGLKQLGTFNRAARLFLLVTVMDGVLISGWQLFLNFYILQAGYSRDFLGLLTSARSAASLLFGIPIGMLSDRIGRRNSMMLGLVSSVITMFWMVTTREPNVMLAMSFLGGVSDSLWILSQSPFMMQVSDEKNRTLLFSFQYGVSTLAGAVGNLFAGQLPALFGTWLTVSEKSATAYQAVVVTSVLASALTLVPLFLIREPRRVVPVTNWNWRALGASSLGRILFRRLTLQLALPNALIGFGAAILIPYLNVFFLDQFAISDETLGLLFSLSAIMTGVGAILVPRVARGLGTKIRAVVGLQGSSVFFLLLIGFAPTLWISGFAFLVRGMLMNMAAPLWSAFSMEQISEHEHGTVNSIQNIAWSLGWAVGPYVSGVVQERYGFAPLFVTTMVMYSLAITLTWLMFHQREHIATATMQVQMEQANL